MKEIIDYLKKEKYYDYLKENSYLIKELYRHPENYKKIIDFFKDKYHLRVTDKISNAIDGVETISSIIDTIK